MSATDTTTEEARRGLPSDAARTRPTLGGIDHRAVLEGAVDGATAYLDSLPDRRVGERASLDELRASLGLPLPDEGVDAATVVADLARDAEAGLVASPGPRYFGFVIGGALPAALGADWLVSAWDQNAGGYVIGPSAAVLEETAARWTLELLGLPATASVGFTTGCQMAHVTALAAARRAVLGRAGWDVEADGLQGAPEVTVVAGAEAHVTIPIALQLLGLGGRRLRRVAADEQGRMRPGALAEALAGTDGPTIVCAQAGNVNTGACDPLDALADVVGEHSGTWLHVDGAFGLWAAAAPRRRHLVRGLERADSWATDAHKWLNVPYDSGIAIVSDAEAHRRSMMIWAEYLVHARGDERDNSEWVPEFSRRARGVPVYAAIRSLGRRGVADLVERCCGLAARMAERLGAAPGVEILNDVTLNQVLVRFGGDDALTRDVITRVQADGTCWLGGTTWHEMAAMRISVSGWLTTEADIDRSADAILRCYQEAGGGV